MNYYFDIKYATLYGLDEAIFLQNIIYWIEKNKASNKNFHDNKYWTYASAESFTLLFPFWTRRQVERIIISLVDQKLIIIGNYNKFGFDKTRWFSLVDDSMSSTKENIKPDITAPAIQTDTNQTKDTLEKNKFINLVISGGFVSIYGDKQKECANIYNDLKIAYPNLDLIEIALTFKNANKKTMRNHSMYLQGICSRKTSQLQEQAITEKSKQAKGGIF